MNPLLDGGRAANLKLEQSGVKFATPTVNKINALPESPNEVAERMMMIERLGGVLKYADVADRVFRSNLLMIDLHFPRVLTEMVRIMHLDGISRISELTEVIKQMNPLKIKDELINKHKFYEFKMKQFLMALVLGMRPAKIYNGLDSAVEGILLVDGNGEVLCYHKSEKQIMEDFLFLNTRLEKGSLEKDSDGDPDGSGGRGLPAGRADGDRQQGRYGEAHGQGQRNLYLYHARVQGDSPGFLHPKPVRDASLHRCEDRGLVL